MQFRPIFIAISLCLACGATSAADEHAGHAGHASPAQRATIAQAAPVTEGEVRKIDKAQGKITLKHGEIRNLDMPPMTMVFKVKDASMLDKVQPGDKVGFTADKVAGEFTVTSIEARK